jgi:transcriptional regulator
MTNRKRKSHKDEGGSDSSNSLFMKTQKNFSSNFSATKEKVSLRRDKTIQLFQNCAEEAKLNIIKGDDLLSILSSRVERSANSSINCGETIQELSSKLSKFEKGSTNNTIINHFKINLTNEVNELTLLAHSINSAEPIEE